MSSHLFPQDNCKHFTQFSMSDLDWVSVGVNTPYTRKSSYVNARGNTARRAASARYAALSNGGGVPRVPPSPSRPGRGGTPGTPHHPDLAGVPPTIQTWLGYPPPPSRPVWGTPHPRLGMGYPPTTQTWLGYSPPPPSRPICGYPPPPPRHGMEYPQPQMLTDRHL